MAEKGFCSFQILLLKQCGIWPADRKSIMLHLLQKLYLYFQMVNLLLISLALILGAFFSADLKNVSSSVDMVTLTLSALYKAWFVNAHIHKFQRLIEFMNEKFKACIRNENGDMISVEEKSKNCSLSSSLLCLSGAFVMFLYSIVPVLENEAFIKNSNSTEQLFRQIKFPLLTWIPFDVYWSPMYEFFYFIHSFALFSSANIYLVNDSFFFMMIYQIFIQMKMLKEMLMNLGNGKFDYANENLEVLQPNGISKDIRLLLNKNAKYTIDDVDNLNLKLDSDIEMSQVEKCRFENEMHLKLRMCILFHSNILKVIMTIEKLFRSMILADVLHAIISLSFALHETGVADSIFNRIKMYMFLMVCIVHQLGNSFYGQMLLNAQGMISDAVYNLRWLDTNIHTKKCLILILARSNKFTILNGGKMYHLRFESFILFMKTLFSYYMVLRQASTK